MTRCRALALLLLPLLVAGRGEAISIGFSPSPVTASAGGSFSLDLVVAGLGDGVAPSLGAYDLDVLFESSLVSLDSVSFGSLLGGPGDSIQDASEIVAGTWDVSELSFLLPSELDALQPGSFVLASLGFTALADGVTSVTLAGNAIAGDGFGNPLEVQLGAARVEIGGGAVVPEPGGALLFGLGALAVAGSRRRPSQARGPV